MTLPSDIPASVAERAAILMDAHRNVADDLEYTARIIMAVESAPKVKRAGLTPKIAAALDWISDYISANGYSPTFQEMAAGLGLSTKSGVARILDELEERGAITRIAGHSRSVVVVGG